MELTKILVTDKNEDNFKGSKKITKKVSSIPFPK